MKYVSRVDVRGLSVAWHGSLIAVIKWTEAIKPGTVSKLTRHFIILNQLCHEGQNKDSIWCLIAMDKVINHNLVSTFAFRINIEIGNLIE